MSIAICLLMITSISTSITQNAGQTQNIGQPISSSSGTGGLADSPWPMFRQNLNHSGLSPFDTSGNNGKEKWTFTTDGGIDSSPTIDFDGTIYFGADDNKLYAIDSNGNQKWNITTGNHVNTSPAIDFDGTIYIGSWDKNVYAVNTDGTEKWSFMTGLTVDSSPAIGSDGTIYVGSYDYNLYAINSNGTKKWSYTTGHEIRSSPAIGPDGTIYVGSKDNKIYAINPNGIIKWSFTTGAGIVSSPAIGAEGTIYVGSRDNKLHAINPNGTEKWSFMTGANVDSSPAISYDGTIYVGSNDGRLYALNHDGTEKWNFTTYGNVFPSPAIGNDGTIYIGSYDSYVYAINPNGTEKWNFKTNQSMQSSPAIGSDGTIYIGSGNKLFAIGTSSIPPTAEAGSDQTMNEGDIVLFNCSASYDPDGYIVKYDYDFGDGTSTTYIPPIITETNILVYVTEDGSYTHYPKDVFEPDLEDILEQEGYSVTLTDRIRTPTITEALLAPYDQLWIFSTRYDASGVFSQSEIDTILTYREAGKGLLIMADHTHEDTGKGFDKDADQIAHHLGVDFYGEARHGGQSIEISPIFNSHPVFANVNTLCSAWSEGTILVTDPANVYVVAIHNNYSMIAVRDDGRGKVVFDASFTRAWYDGFQNSSWRWIRVGDTPQYFINIASWLGGRQKSLPPPLIRHVYGDDGVFNVTLKVTDNQGLSNTDTCVVTVLNVDPIVTIESISMNVEIGLRVAGRKYNDVGMTLNEDNVPIGYLSIERMPGSPDEQMVWIPLSVDFSKSYSATITFTPEDPPNIGGNPVWIYLKSQNGSIKKIHHTFNVQQSKKRDSDHWNHVEPWEVDLNDHFTGLPFEITAHITDPGSDDEILTYSYGSQVKSVTYLNNPPNPDPYPSPEVNPVDIMDTATLVYEGPGTVTLVLKDDDNIRLGVGEGTDYLSVG